MQENKALYLILLIMKIVLISVLALSFIFFTYTLIDAHIESIEMANTPSDGGIKLDPLPVAFVVVLIFSLITNGVCMILSFAGLIISICYKTSQKRKKNILAFSLLLITPAILELFYILYYRLAS